MCEGLNHEVGERSFTILDQSFRTSWFHYILMKEAEVHARLCLHILSNTSQAETTPRPEETLVRETVIVGDIGNHAHEFDNLIVCSCAHISGGGFLALGPWLKPARKGDGGVLSDWYNIVAWLTWSTCSTWSTTYVGLLINVEKVTMVSLSPPPPSLLSNEYRYVSFHPTSSLNPLASPSSPARLISPAHTTHTSDRKRDKVQAGKTASC